MRIPSVVTAAISPALEGISLGGQSSPLGPMLSGSDELLVHLSAKTSTRYPTGTKPSWPAIRDLNGDAAPDVVVSYADEPLVSVFLSAETVVGGSYFDSILHREKLKRWRKKEFPSLANDFKAWMDAVESTLIPTDPLAEAIRYYRNHWDALFCFVDHPEIPIDNSASEREYQQVAKMPAALVTGLGKQKQTGVRTIRSSSCG